MDWKSVGEAVLPYLRAFLIGGGLCVLAQILIDKTKLTPARILVVYVVAGVFLGGVGLYRHLADFGGAGATTPLGSLDRASYGGGGRDGGGLGIRVYGCIGLQGKAQGLINSGSRTPPSVYRSPPFRCG